MKILKRYTKKRRVSPRRQLRWQRDMPMTICMLDWKQKKVKRSCTDWMAERQSRERCKARDNYKG